MDFRSKVIRNMGFIFTVDQRTGDGRRSLGSRPRNDARMVGRTGSGSVTLSGTSQPRIGRAALRRCLCYVDVFSGEMLGDAPVMRLS